MKKIESPVDLTVPVTLREVRRLMRYAAEQGADPEGNILPKLSELVTAVDAAESPAVAEEYDELLKHYSALTARTSPVNGRTLIETDESVGYLRLLMLVTIGILTLAVFDGGLAAWRLEQPEMEPGTTQKLCDFFVFALDYLRPFIWGSLGACVYLMKRIYDIAGDQEFDSTRLKGWFLRVILGGILGGVVYQIYALGETGDTAMVHEVSGTALAFLTGLGVKIVYGAMERTIEVLAEKLNLGAVRLVSPAPRSARALLAKKLAEVDPHKSPEKHRALLELLEELSRPQDIQEEDTQERDVQE